MLNDIRVHIHSNEAIQEAIEARSAPHIEKTYKQNRSAFAKYIPSLVHELDSISNSNISIFCNQNEEYNIVDFGLGRTFYGEAPLDEITRQYQHFSQHAAYLNLSDFSFAAQVSIESGDSKDIGTALHAFQSNAKFVETKAKKADILVILGLGLGYHIDWLIEHCLAKHVIIYEPEKQYFKSSCTVKDWQSLLEKANRSGISLYFQLGKNASDIVQDLSELAAIVEVKDVMLFQHYYHPTFDAVMQAFRTKSWTQMKSTSSLFSIKRKFTQYTPPWLSCPNIHSLSAVSYEQPRFISNLDAFKKYYPNIYKEFVTYKPQTWTVVENHIDQVNLLNGDNGACWYGNDPADDGYHHYKSFEQFPNKDGLILGYNGVKLKHYLHYRLVKKTEQLLQHAEDEASFLPDQIKSLILFGLGAGYQLESLFKHKEIEKLFICEPNRDFFYASLFAIDWTSILQKVDETGANLYINIGDDGTHLFRDLLGQFYNVGPYVLSQTFFYQGYYNAALNESVVQLREQLQIVVSMGEYFDHACYAIEHTKEALRKSTPFLRSKPSAYLTTQQKELPVVFVGNGPSLDYSIETIRELQGNAIILSCGTALQVLQQNSIVPDFHAEIELNRATYDWAYRVDDLEYLKKITLLSCNGIHPDTCDLYKDVKFAFKEGESATVSALNVIGEDIAESLEFSFPTVLNFAVNLFLKLGFNQFYLVGIDMGFVDSGKHHSSQSGYYNQQGKEHYKYAEANNTGLRVPGNFRSVVSTKHEFKLAKTILEQALAAHQVDCYNTSDGARIEGAVALNIDNILLMSTAEQKQDVLRQLESCFYKLPADTFIEKFDSKYNKQLVLEEICELQNILQKIIHTQDDVFDIIEKQKQFLFHSYKKGNSLFFYYFYGTMNYINSVLSKAAMHQDRDIAVDVAQQAILLWSETLSDVKSLLANTVDLFDTSSSFTILRERLVLAKQNHHEIVVNTFDLHLSHLVSQCMNSLATNYSMAYSVNTMMQGEETSSSPRKASCNSMKVEQFVIFCIRNTQDWEHLTACLERQNSDAQKHRSRFNVLICLMGDYKADWFKHVTVYKYLTVSFQILPQLLEFSSAADYREGRVPFSPLNLHLESAIKHLNDLDDYSIFVEKLHFSAVGLKNARKINMTSGASQTDVPSGVRDDNLTLEQRLNESASDKNDLSKSTMRSSPEDDSEAHRYIERNIVERVSVKAFVDYKTYIGIPRNKSDMAAGATICDSANSRGLKIARQFHAVELFQSWQNQSAVESSINIYIKAQ